MIHRGDVDATLRAWKPETTEEEITRLYEQMMVEWSDLANRIAHQTRLKWTAHHGHQPDGLSWGQIQDRAKYQAEQQIRAIHLDPITQEIVARDAEEEDEEDQEQEALYQQTLQLPGQWRDSPGHVRVSPDTEEYVEYLWEEESATFWMYAEALIEHLKYTGQSLPRTREGERYDELTQMVREAEAADTPYQP